MKRSRNRKSMMAAEVGALKAGMSSSCVVRPSPEIPRAVIWRTPRILAPNDNDARFDSIISCSATLSTTERGSRRGAPGDQRHQEAVFGRQALRVGGEAPGASGGRDGRVGLEAGEWEPDNMDPGCFTWEGMMWWHGSSGSGRRRAGGGSSL